MPSASHFEHLQRSREEILGEIGEHPDLVLIRGFGNRGDELIWAGTRNLLEVLVYREIGVAELPSARGHTALICGGGAFCRSFHELMPHVLAMAELRFERVIVLPSSFDTSVDVVHDALQRSQALVFAREQESYRRIQALCDARLAHDCAFFYDFSPHRTTPGRGTLNAFRNDEESTGEHALPPDNDDISMTAVSLDAWLRRIAAHELIRTDRAHVMIAAAMLDKRVEFISGSYFKVPAIAEYALSGFPVTRLDAGRTAFEACAEHARARLAPTPCSPEAQATRAHLKARAEAILAPLPHTPGDAHGDPRVTTAILSHERPEMTLGAIHSVLETTEQAGIPVSLLVIDNNSSERTRQILSAVCGEHPSIELRFSDRDLGCAGGRGLALELATSELVLFLDEATELMPGALAQMLSELDHHPEAYAVGATVLLPDGRVSHSGGWYRESRELVRFTLAHAGSTLEQGELPPSGVCDWIPGTAALVRRGLFEQFPLDPGMGPSCEDVEWCLRVADTRPGCFRRCREALVLHHAEQRPLDYSDLRVRARVIDMIATAAHFYRRHRRLLRAPDVDPFALLPELVQPDGTLELASARILMELASTHDGDWLLLKWMNGGLDPLLRGAKEAERGKRDAESLAALDTQLSHAREELETAGRQLDDARIRIEAVQEERDEAWRRLERIYRSRLWKLGASYDRARRGVRAIRSLGGRR